MIILLYNGGLLNADQIEVRPDGQSEAKEIGGETIRILAKKRERINWFMRKIRQSGLVVDTIEGDQVELEYTKASVVRGKSVKIGTGCEIGLVEVEGDYRAAEDARVAEVRRIGEEQ
jgi:cytoskeletal protein CcmA (bactofilin family)